MLEKLLRQLISSFGIFFRTIRAFFTRRLMGVTSYFRRATNFSRQATKVASESVQGVAAAVKKPTKREDYIETERLFISKSFLILAAVALVLFGLFCYFVAWPFILSHFLTARFYQEDSRIPDWTGKVIVYYDKEKRTPMYSGRLTDGVLQGSGMEYDEDGLLIYEGEFSDGVRNGRGTGYIAGVLAYEGEFAGGVYEGTGILYEDGQRIYQGAFARGLANGLGTAYKDGAKCYEGSFVDGLYEGEGVTYDETGRMCYRGSYAAGLYDGGGTVYLKNGDRIQSEFSAGVGCGVIQWYRHDRLWYNGGADDLTPEGFGTIYAPNGKVIYAGEMDYGTLDGAWLLARTAQELREIFGEAVVKEANRVGGGFLITNADLSLTVLCTLRQGEEEPHAYRIWFVPEEESDSIMLLPWADRMAAETWAGTNRGMLQSSARDRGKVYLPSGGVGEDWHQSIYYYEDHNRSLVSREAESAPFQIIWAQPGGLDLFISGDAADESVAQAQKRLDGLLEVLESFGSDSGGSEGSATDPSDVERLLALMLTPQDACNLINALTDYYAYGQAVEALEASRPLLEQNLVEQQILLERSQGSQSAVDSAQDRLDSLDSQLVQYRILQEQAKLAAEKLTGLKIEGYELGAVLRVFDVTGLVPDTMYDKSLAYAREVSAGRYDVDAAQIELDVKTQILDLTLAYENVRTGQKSLERTETLLEEVMQAYTTGTTDKAALYSAQCSVNEAAAALFQSMGAYTKLVNRLNDLSGGWLAEEYDWFADSFAVIYDTAIRQARAEAEAEKLRPADSIPEELGGADPEAGTTDSDNETAVSDAETEESGPG